MPWVFLQSFEVLSCHSLYRLRELLEMSPETRRCPVHLQVSESPLCLRIQGLGSEQVKPACLGVFLNLLVPISAKTVRPAIVATRRNLPLGGLEWPAEFPQCSSYSFLLAVRRRSAFLTSCSTIPAYGGLSGFVKTHMAESATALPLVLSSARRGGRPTPRRRGCRLGPARPVGRRGSTGRRSCRC